MSWAQTRTRYDENRMQVISRSTLTRFVETLAGKKDESSQDIKRAYSGASVVSAERVVFNIKGNSYRFIVSIDYPRQTVFVKWLGSHKDYDSIDARTVDYGNQTYQKRPGSR
jgi:mRNA interferase HigB